MTSIRWSSITFTSLCFLLLLQLQPTLPSPSPTTANTTLITTPTQSNPSPNILPSSSSTSSHQLPIGWFTSDRLLNKLVKRQLYSQSETLRRPSALQKRQTAHSRSTVDSEFRNNSLSSGAGSIEHSHEELFRIVPEVHNIYLALTLIPAFIVLFGSFSAFVKEKLYIGESTISVVFGIILGPYVSGVFDPRSWAAGENFDDLTLELTRIVVALSVFAVGVELPKAYILRHWRSLAILLGPAMLFGWIVSGALIYALVPALTFLQALVIAAAVTPTDPVLAASVVGKGKYAQKHVPAHLRHLLQAESGCNDGAAFPFLYLAMFLLMRQETGVGSVIGQWLLLVVLYQILLGILIGVAVGILARKTLKFCKRRSMIDKESMVAMYVALALLTTGVTALAGSDDLLAAFACGAAFAWDDWFTESIETSNFSSILDLLINCTTFIYIGATIPFSSWNDATLTLVPWRLVVLGFSIILLRRLPILVIMQKIVPDLKTHREAVFSGHFGPIGVGALFISTLATAKLPTPQNPPQTSLDILALTTQSLIYLLIFFSVLIHGLSIPFFTLGKNVHSRVHTMTRTWTQASGNEPSWLSRVKRVERPVDGNLDVPRFDEKDPQDSVAVPPPEPTTSLEPGQRQISDDQITRVGDQNPLGEIRERPPSPNEELQETRPPLTGSMTDPGSQHQQPVTTRVGMLRLGSRTKRTPEEQAARQREKMIRDAWCRPERIDVLKKGEERVYKSGRRLVVERGDGDEVEVHELPRESSKKSLRELANLQAFSNPTSDGSGPSNRQPHTGLARKFDLAKLIAPRIANKPKTTLAPDASTGMPLPGQGPRSGTLLEEQLKDEVVDSYNATRPPASCSEQSGQSQEVWDEGNKIVIENKDGSNVHVVSPPMNELRSPCSLPTMAIASDLSSFPPRKLSSNHSLPIPPVDCNDPDNDHQNEGQAGLEKAPADSIKEDCDDEWEEDDGTPETNETGSSSNFYDGPVDRNRSTTSHRLYPSRHSRRSRRKGSARGPGSPSVAARQSIDSVRRTAGGSRMVEFVEVEKQGLGRDRSRMRRSSRSPSPSRSIRFAEYPDRPTKKSTHFHHRSSSTKAYHKNSPAKNKASRLKNFVAPAVDSWRRSSMASGNLTPSNLDSASQRASYVAAGAAPNEEPPPPSTSSGRPSVLLTDLNNSQEEDVPN
ncbi:uncharacterized protein PGTG_17678 [Puccinia graminis f. sp. tritici CRL 75-36-700-3]|uniref:Cation/H+ exchanger transmembrane domain-containing protein n=1 Tax=Puccinia graminis f. sp. tritici (strain CRL 75-36-700-3 / race SCCL) TaxID=418459 RepID=E3L4Z9_PUCGT|nr:uncharacterized protein PGTG_17678 [Puccinia graminis f. sp. tritici CRL 75-36-700-3]EFP91624.1 hypothetical protein PGTG_17678 [Puccinia graminis f. sp. tritici CRL 75-36-700-3]